MKDKLLLLLAFLSVLCSCQRGEADYDDSPQANLDALWNIIDKQYCFLDYKERELGFTWADIHAKYSARLNPQMSRVQLFEVLCQMAGELKDGHVNISSSLDLGRNWSWKEDYPLNLDEELRDAYLQHDYNLAAGIKYRILPDNIAYVVYESFQNAAGEGNLDDMFFALRMCNGMILDIRSNGGGNLDNETRLASRFTNEKVLVGYRSHKTGTGHNDFSPLEAEYIEPSKGVRWQKPCVVLTNRSCYSAANTFVRDMKEMPLVTVVGDYTGGGSGLPFSSELPIGWSVRFSASPHFDARKQQIEFGIAPDILCSLDAGQAARGSDSMIERARSLLSEE